MKIKWTDGWSEDAVGDFISTYEDELEPLVYEMRHCVKRSADTYEELSERLSGILDGLKAAADEIGEYEELSEEQDEDEDEDEDNEGEE